MVRRLAILAVLCGTALADDDRAIRLKIDETVKRDVGYARGLLCDDTSIVNASVTTDVDRDVNVLIVTGRKVGETLCRVGTVAGRPTVIYDIIVSAKPSPRR